MPIKLLPAGFVVTCVLAWVSPSSAPPPPPSAATITVDPNVRRQTFHSWEGAILSTVRDYDGISPAQWGRIFDVAVDDLGYTRVRLSIQSGVEGSGSNYRVVNDDLDPTSINPAGFNWTTFDQELDIAAAFRARVIQSGQKPYVSLNYVDFSGGRSVHLINPLEYAEFMVAVFQHIQARNGFVPEAVEAMLEPNDTEWTPTILGTAIVIAGARLKAAGFEPEWIAPSTSNLGAASLYIDGIMAVPGAASLVAEFSYHRYSGDGGDLDRIVQRAVQYGKRTSMLEYWGDFVNANSGAGYRQLGQDITRGQVSAWQQGVFADNFGCVSEVMQLVNGTPQLCPNTKLTRQWTKYIRPGAQGIGVNSPQPFENVAFINPDGKYVVVVKAEENAGSFTVGGLPPGTYERSRTDASADQPTTQLPDVTIQAGGAVAGDLPTEGVFTIVSKSGGAPSPPPPPVSSDTQPPSVSVAAPPSPLSGLVILPVSCSDNVGCTSLQLRVDGVDVGSAETDSPFALQWNSLTVGDGPHQLTVVAKDAAGNTSVTSPLSVTVMNALPGNPPPPPPPPPPTNGGACEANPITVSVYWWPSTTSGVRSRPDYRVTTNGEFSVTFSSNPQQVTVTNSFGCSVVVVR